MGYDFQRLPPAPPPSTDNSSQTSSAPPRRPETFADLDQYYLKGDSKSDDPVQRDLANREQTRERLMASAIDHDAASNKAEIDHELLLNNNQASGAPLVGASTIQGVQLNQAGLNAIRAKQQAANAMLQQRQGQTLTSLAMSRGQENAINSALAAKASPVAATALGQTMGALGQQIGQQRLAEQQQNTGAYAGALGNLRTQQDQTAQTAASLADKTDAFNMQQQNQAAQANLQAKLQNRQQTDEQTQFLLQSRFGIDQQDLNATVAAHQAYENAQLERDQMAAAQDQEAIKQGGAILNGTVAATGAALSGMWSDKRVKKHVHRKPKYTRKFLDSIKGYGE